MFSLQPVRAAVPIERVSEARTTFEECVNLYYKKPEVETLLLSPKRDHVAHALRYTLAASFAPLEDHHADGTLSKQSSSSSYILCR